MPELRALVIVLGDQLDLDAAAFDGFDAATDAVWMAEVAEESTHVWSSKARTVLFLSAMRHFASALQGAGRPLHYTRLDAQRNAGSLGAQLHGDIARLRPGRLVMTAPGDWRVLQAIRTVAAANSLALDIRTDRHFFNSVREFAASARRLQPLRMEFFYREQRQRHGVLMQGLLRQAAGGAAATAGALDAPGAAAVDGTEDARPDRRRGAAVGVGGHPDAQCDAGADTEADAHADAHADASADADADAHADAHADASAGHDADADGNANPDAATVIPTGGRWNFDTDNRAAFGTAGPGSVPARTTFAPDAVTREVIALVEARFSRHPGATASFGWPVTRAQALQCLQGFIALRLPLFGRYQDAMWPGEPWLYHAQLSAALNLKLLNPREVVKAAEAAYDAGHAPLASVEGFIRQILGWREYVRGVYWTLMPGYAQRNALEARQDLPAWYWTGETDMACLHDTLMQTLTHGYAHHIQRLMVTGLYALLLGVQPQQVHAWYLAVYVDAVEWAELPNTLGMSQYADGGVMGSKPYIASGRYIQRMSPYCKGCRYDPGQRVGDSACPFTTLYWNFLVRHQALLATNPRMAWQLKSLPRLNDAQRLGIQLRAEAIRRGDVGAAASPGQATLL